MAVLRLFPNVVLSGSSFTTAQLANVLGDTTAYAVHTGVMAVDAGYGGMFKFPFSNLPSNIGTISQIEAGIVGKANLANSRQFLSFDCYNGGTILFKSQPSNVDDRFTTTDSTLLMDTTTVTGGAFNSNAALWRNDNIEVTANFRGIANPGSSITTSWQKFWLDITYELAAGSGPPNQLFQGENF